MRSRPAPPKRRSLSAWPKSVSAPWPPSTTILAGAGVDHVVAGAGVHPVVAGAADQQVEPVGAVELVVAGPASR